MYTLLVSMIRVFNALVVLGHTHHMCSGALWKPSDQAHHASPVAFWDVSVGFSNFLVEDFVVALDDVGLEERCEVLAGFSRSVWLRFCGYTVDGSGSVFVCQTNALRQRNYWPTPNRKIETVPATNKNFQTMHICALIAF